ncbi:MAG: hypothetical protein ACFFE5_08575 [Candidatus Thorarchaeota archaeon]
MFCSNCGEKLANTEKKFCQNCGAEIFIYSQSKDSKLEKKQNNSELKIYNIQESRLQRGHPGKFSKLCLWFALVSILIGLVPLIVGITLIGYMYLIFNTVRVTITIAFFILLIMGLVLGIFSKIYGSRAEIFEPKNNSERAGSILLVFGIILNITGLLLSFISPFSIFTLQY